MPDYISRDYIRRLKQHFSRSFLAPTANPNHYITPPSAKEGELLRLVTRGDLTGCKD